MLIRTHTNSKYPAIKCKTEIKIVTKSNGHHFYPTEQQLADRNPLNHQPPMHRLFLIILLTKAPNVSAFPHYPTSCKRRKGKIGRKCKMCLVYHRMPLLAALHQRWQSFVALHLYHYMHYPCLHMCTDRQVLDYYSLIYM